MLVQDALMKALISRSPSPRLQFPSGGGSPSIFPNTKGISAECVAPNAFRMSGTLGTSENQLRVKDYIVGLGYTDVSDVKDRGYFFSVYLRTPGGALFELAYSTEAGFTIDEPVEELGTHMCIPPHWEDRRSEIDQLEPIDTIETVVD